MVMTIAIAKIKMRIVKINTLLQKSRLGVCFACSPPWRRTGEANQKSLISIQKSFISTTLRVRDRNGILLCNAVKQKIEWIARPVVYEGSRPNSNFKNQSQLKKIKLL
jgi:hypothetical protein